MAKLRMINSSRWQKHATVMITKELEAIAENTGVNVRLVIRDKLDESYKRNLTLSYGPRSSRGVEAQETHKRNTSTYTNTHTLEEAINTIIDGDYVKVVVDETKKYGGDREVPATKVIKWLSEGTRGGGKKTGYYKDENDEWHYNYPTPVHPFEEHTRNEMLGFLDSIEGDIRNKKYTTYRYTGKKKKRTHYKGQEV
jgi:hypothetical protein